MPEISRFQGICVRIYFKDHNPPHVHVSYGDHEAVYDIATLAVTNGSLPRKADALFREWAENNKEEIQKMWDTQEVHKLPPLVKETKEVQNDKDQ